MGFWGSQSQLPAVESELRVEKSLFFVETNEAIKFMRVNKDRKQEKSKRLNKKRSMMARHCTLHLLASGLTALELELEFRIRVCLLILILIPNVGMVHGKKNLNRYMTHEARGDVLSSHRMLK